MALTAIGQLPILPTAIGPLPIQFTAIGSLPILLTPIFLLTYVAEARQAEPFAEEEAVCR